MRELIRGLVEAIVLVPEDGWLRVEIRGELASILALAEGARRNRSSAALLPLGRTDVLGRPWFGVFELSLWMTLPTTRRVSSGGWSC